MTYRKILLKSVDEKILCPVTAQGDPPVLTLPAGVTAKALLVEEVIFPSENRTLSLPQGTTDFSLVAQMGENLLFASTLPKKDRQMAKWRLLNAVKQKESPEKVPKTPLEKEEASLEASVSEEAWQERVSAIAEQEIQEGQASEAPPAFEQEKEETVLERARRLIESGTPFPLLESMMPGSKWVLVPEEEAPYLVGIKEEDGVERVLYGVPGARDFPPDDDLLWSFFPVGEDGEGYFLTEASSSFPTET